MRVRVQRSAAMSCAGCGDTESNGAIFGSADGRCLRCNRPARATGAPTSASGVSKMGLKAELVARLCDALCPDEPVAKRPRT